VQFKRKLEEGRKMRFFCIMLMLAILSGCGTFGGAVSGLGSDLDVVGSYITGF
jgi:hypothetical protein